MKCYECIIRYYECVKRCYDLPDAVFICGEVPVPRYDDGLAHTCIHIRSYELLLLGCIDIDVDGEIQRQR